MQHKVESMRYNLSEITEVIRNRRSIKPEFFSDRKVHPEIISNLLTNAIWAPTHGMNQPWHFKVYREAGLKQLGDKLPELYQEHAGEKFSLAKKEKLAARFDKVSAVVVVCMKRDPATRIPEIEDIEAVACAVQNMFLTATAYGLGAFWSSPGFIYTDQMCDFLKLEQGDRCLGLFYLGYPTIDWPKSHRRPLEYHTEWIEA